MGKLLTPSHTWTCWAQTMVTCIIKINNDNTLRCIDVWFTIAKVNFIFGIASLLTHNYL